MKKVFLLFIFVSTCSLFGQSNLYWKSFQLSKNSTKVITKVSDHEHIVIPGFGAIVRINDLTETVDTIGVTDTVVSNVINIDNRLLYCSRYENSHYIVKFNTISCELKIIQNSYMTSFLNCGSGLIFGLKGNQVYKSTDSGETWEYYITLPFSRVLKWSSDKSTGIYIQTEITKLLKTDFNFSQFQTVAEFSSISKFFVTPTQVPILFVKIAYGKYYKTVDDGLHWDEFPMPDTNMTLSYNIYDGSFVASIYYYSTYRSFDMGSTWSEIYYGKGIFGASMDCLYMLRDHYFYYDNVLYIYNPQLQGETYNNYLPLSGGNKWMYLMKENNKITGTKLIGVGDSVVIDDKKYFKLTQHDIPIRYENNKLFKHLGTEEELITDFNLFQGQRASFLYSEGSKVTTMEKTIRKFADSLLYCKGPAFLTDEFPFNELYSPGIGIVYISNGKHDWYNNYFREEILLQAIIHNDTGIVKYDFAQKPLIEFTPPEYLSGNSLNWNAKVTHVYSPVGTVSLISKVYLEYYYDKVDSSTSFEIIEGIRSQDQRKYDFHLPLDIDLLSRGFKFNYRISAYDRCLITGYSRFPEDGYNSLSWSLTDLTENSGEVSDYSLKSNYPNPFNPSTTISYTLRENSRVVLEVYNIQGQMVRRLVEENQEAGEHTAMFNGENLASGVYIARLRAVSNAGGEIFTKSIKMILMK